MLSRCTCPGKPHTSIAQNYAVGAYGIASRSARGREVFFLDALNVSISDDLSEVRLAAWAARLVEPQQS